MQGLILFGKCLIRVNLHNTPTYIAPKQKEHNKDSGLPKSKQFTRNSWWHLQIT